jgi:hypothetical protein
MANKTNFNDAKPGDKCSNGAWETRFTCPGCYTDHDGEVTQCEGCGVALRCEIEQQPIPVCYIADPDEDD